MRKFLLALVMVVALSLPLFGQGNAVLISFPGVPSGACAFVMVGLNSSNGDFYTCPSGSWVLAGSVGGATVGGITFTWTNPTAGDLVKLTGATTGANAIARLSTSRTDATANVAYDCVTDNGKVVERTDANPMTDTIPALPTAACAPGTTIFIYNNNTIGANTITLQTGSTAVIPAGPTLARARVNGAGTAWQVTWEITGAGTTPSGSTNYVQVNNGGAFGSDVNFQWNLTTHTLNIGSVGGVNGGINMLGLTSGQAGITVAAAAGTPSTWVMPTTDPTNGQLLVAGTPAAGKVQLSWASAGAGAGTINAASQYLLPYYSAAGSATTLSGLTTLKTNASNLIGVSTAAQTIYALLQVGGAASTTASGGLLTHNPALTVSQFTNAASGDSQHSFVDFSDIEDTGNVQYVSFRASPIFKGTGNTGNTYAFFCNPQIASTFQRASLICVPTLYTINGTVSAHVYGMYAYALGGTGTIAGNYSLLYQSDNTSWGGTLSGNAYFFQNLWGKATSQTSGTMLIGEAGPSSLSNVLELGLGNTAGGVASGHLAFTGGKGQHIKTQAAANDIAGTCTAASGTTCAISFTTAYTATPSCVVTPTFAATQFYLSAQATTGFTITYAPSGAATFNYVCIGNPN